MLQVPLRPAPIAPRVIDHVRRHLFPAAAELGQLTDLVASAAHESSLDEVVAQDLSAQRWFSGQARQCAVTRERSHPYDGVVPPAIAVTELPVCEPGGEHRALQPGTELDETAEEALAPDRQRQ